jgi:hypothetical protein
LLRREAALREGEKGAKWLGREDHGPRDHARCVLSREEDDNGERKGVEEVRAKRWVGPMLVDLGCTGMEGKNREG